MALVCMANNYRSKPQFICNSLSYNDVIQREIDMKNGKHVYINVYICILQI